MRKNDRSLSVRLDDEPFAVGSRFHLYGKLSIGLFPSLFVLEAWNLSESDYYKLMHSKNLSVMHGDSCLASGTISDVYRRTIPEGTLTSVAFSLGLDLWEASVSLSVEAGVSVSETVRRILDASGCDVFLLSFPGSDPIFSRGQSFYGRAAECVASALSAAIARGYLVPAGLCVIPEEPLPATLHLTEQDLVDRVTVSNGGKYLILSTMVTGFQPGEEMTLQVGNVVYSGLILERMVDADNVMGSWDTQLLVLLRQ